MINDSYQWFFFTISKAWHGTNGWPRQFLNENDIEICFEFKNSIYDKIVFSNIL